MTHSYQEKSLWLKNELECIRKLIEQNPRDPLTANAEEAVEKTTESVPAAPSSSSVTFKDDDNTTRKRKSPETAYSHVDMIQQHQQDKVSPHQKRTTSFDLEDVLTKLNLPINLDRLTKGQLLSEVEKRGGCGSLSMKSLKKELIDGLKERLLDEYKRSSEAAPSNACQTTRLASNVPTAVSVEDKPVVIEASLSISAPTETLSSSTVAQSQPTPSKGVRKGSLMEEFRHLVNSSNLSGTGSSSIASNSSSGATNTTSSDDKEKVAAEFQARQNRHRDSMARKSQLQMEYSKSSSSSSSSSSSEITQHKAFSDPTTLATIATAAVSVDDEQGKASSQNESKSDDNTVSSSTSIGTAYGGIWCDVSSPMKTGEEEDVVVVTNVTEEEKDKVVIVEVAVDKSTSGGKEQQVVVVETAVSSVKAAVAAIQQKAINEEPKGTSKAHIHTAVNNSSNTVAKAPPHKTGGGSTTHNKTAATAKAVVSSQPHLSTHATEAQSASHAAPVKKGLFSGMSMFGSKKTVSPPATVVSTSTIASQSKATAVVPIVSPIADHQVSSINTTTTTSPTTNDDAATSASIPHANSEVQSVPVASSIAIAAFDVTAVTSSDAVVQKHLLTTTTTTAPTANEGKKKDARLINAIAPSAAAAAVTATNTAPTTSTSSSSSLKLKDAFASKNLITSIVSNYNAALASPTPLLQQSASVPSISMHPVNATTIAATTTTDSVASASSVTSSSLSDTVLSAATTQQQQQVNETSPSTNDEEEYIIEDR